MEVVTLDDGGSKGAVIGLGSAATDAALVGNSWLYEEDEAYRVSNCGDGRMVLLEGAVDY